MAFLVMGVSGLLINLLIINGFDVAVLGVFNQIYAVYVIASQFAAGGIHLSVLKHVAEFSDDKKICSSIMLSSVLVAIVLGGIFAFILWASGPTIGKMANSPDVGQGLLYAAPGLFFFSLNKVLLAGLNGLRHMRIFSVGQSSRYVLIILFIILAESLKWPPPVLGMAFTFAEGLTFLLIFLVMVRANWGRPLQLVHWMKVHTVFGLKGFFSLVLLEANARVDIIMLGWFTQDYVVGIYSLAAVFMEGFQSCMAVIRNNLNPILVKLIKERDVNGLRGLVNKTQRIVYPAMMLILGGFLLVYKPLLQSFVQNDVLTKSLPLLIILFCGLLAYSGYSPFNSILVQGGLPGYQTGLLVITVISNVALNAIMIPLFGAEGAAFATVTSLMAFVIILQIFVKYLFGFNLGFFPRSVSF